MRRRVISLGSLGLAVVALAVVLYTATLVDRRPPGVARVSLSAPAGASLAQTLTAIDIEFSEPVVTASVERRFRIVPYVPGTLTWDGSTAIFSPSERLPLETEFAVYVDPGFEDLAGNAASTGLDGWAFTTVGPPVVVTTAPADGSAGVAVDAGLAITFDRLMDTRAVEAAIRVEPAAAIRAAWSGPAVSLAFEQPLLFGTTYAVTVGTAAADTAGNRLRAPFTTRFSTVAAGLGVTATVPADGVAGASVRTPIAVLFDGPIEPASVAEALRITPSVDGTFDVISLPSDAGPRLTTDAERPGTILRFRPASPLAPHTTYTVSLDPVVGRAGSPDQVAAGRTWRFTTGQPAVSGQNQIAFLSARGGVRNVWLMNPDGSNARQLTTELVPVGGFDVTTDGSRIAWSAGGEVRTMSLDGSAERTITTDAAFEYGPAFAPDGLSLLVGRRDAAGADLGYWLVPVADAGGQERQVLPAGAPPLGSVLLAGDGIGAGEGTPAWSRRAAFDPTGRWIAVTTGSGAVVRIDLRPEDPLGAVVEVGLVALAGPAWSPADNRFVVVARRPGESSDALHAIDLAGVAVRRSPGDGSVAAAADGTLAALDRDSSGATHVAVLGRGDATPRALTSAGDLSDRWPAFAPDGRSIVFGRVDRGPEEESAGIWLVDAPTGRLSALAADGAYPRWLP